MVPTLQDLEQLLEALGAAELFRKVKPALSRHSASPDSTWLYLMEKLGDKQIKGRGAWWAASAFLALLKAIPCNPLFSAASVLRVLAV